MTRPRIDLNCDLGESFGSDPLGHDARLMPSITSANVACGYHAGDATVMRNTTRLALEHGVAVGAHPGFPDRAGFGRRPFHASPSEIGDMVVDQVGALSRIVVSEGGRLRHVKPHGALYNMAASDRRLADAVATAVASVDVDLVLFGLSGSCLLDAGRAAGLVVASEVFADRAYDREGRLVSREMSGAVIDDASIAVERAVQIVTEGHVTAITGESVAMLAETICVHGDSPGSADLAAAIRRGLEAAGVEVASCSH
jgi:UPF0271 protein